MNKDDLLKKLREKAAPPCDMPPIDIEGISYEDTYAQFVSQSRAAGAQVVEARHGDDLGKLIKGLYPEAKTFATHLSYIGLPGKNPDTVESAAELNGTDVGIVEGTVGVAENACVWVPQTMKERAVCFISEYLVILLDRKNIVDNMHQAYRLIDMDPQYNFGTFISGPSSTADIEQALVRGAQAARGVTVVVLS